MRKAIAAVFLSLGLVAGGMIATPERAEAAGCSTWQYKLKKKEWIFNKYADKKGLAYTGYYVTTNAPWRVNVEGKRLMQINRVYNAGKSDFTAQYGEYATLMISKDNLSYVTCW